MQAIDPKTTEDSVVWFAMLAEARQRGDRHQMLMAAERLKALAVTVKVAEPAAAERELLDIAGTTEPAKGGESATDGQ